MSIFAGYRTPILVAVVLAVIGVGFTTIQWLRDTGKQELQIEQLQEQLDIRKRIDEADRTSPRNVDDADRLLREFLDSNR